MDDGSLAEVDRLIDAEQFDKAGGLLRVALLQPHTSEESVEVFLRLAKLHFRRGEVERARQFIQRVLVDAPDHAVACSVSREIETACADRQRRVRRSGLLGLTLVVAVLAVSLIAFL